MADGDNGGKKSGVLSDLVKAESMIQMALALPIGCLLGWFGGDLLDKHFHTSWMAVAGIVLGAAAGFFQMFSTASKFLKRGGKSE